MAITAALIAAAFALFLLFEHLRPLRPEVEPKWRRVARNLAVVALSLTVAFPLQLALLVPASTALRFHFGEQALAVCWRAAQIVVIGAEPMAVWIWQIVLFVSILFHHSNVRLPARLESVMALLVVTPRMHGIHHAQREEWTHSNWSSILTCWDFLHRTMVTRVPDAEIAIGIPAYDDPREVTLGRIMLLPLRRRDEWAK
jgi:hypothetical protein